jgi:hypothetical protein
MTRQETMIIVTLGAVALGLAILTGRADVPPPVQGAVEGVTWRPGYPAGHEHLAHPADIGTVLWGPHPIYCDPAGPGKYRDPLIARGWADWISDPPSEATI